MSACLNLVLTVPFKYRYSISVICMEEVAMGGKKMDLLRGTLDLLILQVLQLQPLHGVAVADRIRQVTKGTFDVPAGSLFPALHRLELEGWIEGEWSVDNGRRIKC